MPSAGDEGYETLIVCPYDKAHEIRKGRMQFHLEKCRRNFPMSQLVDCPYNKGHLVPKQELEYHMEEECDSRATWERFTHEAASTDCPVRDLVPVNAATVPDGEENWDNFETTGSVLNHIKAEAENKPIVRMCQVASKATRKAFRVQERLRHSAMTEAQRSTPNERALSDTASVVSDREPLPKPRRQPNVLVVKQDPTKAVAAINKQFRTLDLNMKIPKGNVAPSDTSSMINGPPSEYETASTSRQMPFSYAAASKAGAGRPPSAMSDLSTGNSSTSMMTALTSHRASGGNSSRPPTAMSGSTCNSFTTASQGTTDRPPSAMSDSSAGNSTVSSMPASSIHRPPNSAASRPSTAMSIAASAALYKRAPPVDEEGFCQIPIPGLGRGKRKPVQ